MFLGLASLSLRRYLVPTGEKRAVRKATLELMFTIVSQETLDQIELIAIVPQTIPTRQVVSKLRYTPTPDEIYQVGGQSYARFLIKAPPKSVKIRISADIKVFRTDRTMLIQRPELRLSESEQSLKRFLSPEQLIQSNSAPLKLIAGGLKGKDDETTVRNCFEFVVGRLRPDPDAATTGAADALRLGRGSCQAFSDLFVALCRANSLPARECIGYLVQPPADSLAHAWTEVYSDIYGWVPYDPYFAAFKHRASFDKLEPLYFLADRERLNPNLDNFSYCCMRYYGKGMATLRHSIRMQNIKEFKFGFL